MAKPTTRQELKDYCLRQLGAPVLEINVADEQVDDLLDDTIQYFNERHFDGVEKTYLKYKITQEDIDRGRGGTSSAGITTTGVGIVTTTGTSTNISGFLESSSLNMLSNQTPVNLFLESGSSATISNLFEKIEVSLAPKPFLPQPILFTFLS